MRHFKETVDVGSILGIGALVLVTTGWVMPSYSLAGGQMFAGQLGSRFASITGTADDHRAAALLYQEEAKRAQAEVNQYTQTAAWIRPIEDPKGFRRSALMTAAQQHQKYAREMQQFFAEHQTKAKTMLSKQQPQ